MKVIMLLPEFEEGGVERHVLWLSTCLEEEGHEVLLATAGGKLESSLPPGVRVLRLPVHRKNPLAAFYSAVRLAALARHENADLFHAHSRVPAWIARWAGAFSGKPWIVTAHDRYRRNAAIAPFRRADGAICVSEAVRTHLEGFLPDRNVVIKNGIPDPPARWRPREGGPGGRLLFVGRLTKRKGLHVALSALAELKEHAWSLDVVGDGPQRSELESQALALGIEDRVRFHGFRDDVADWMADKDCLLFPSFDEGMPLTLMQAIRVGLPVLASKIAPVAELVEDESRLIPPGDTAAWKEVLLEVLDGRKAPPVYDPGLVPSDARMSREVLGFYGKTLFNGKGEAP